MAIYLLWLLANLIVMFLAFNDLLRMPNLNGVGTEKMLLIDEYRKWSRRERKKQSATIMKSAFSRLFWVNLVGVLGYISLAF